MFQFRGKRNQNKNRLIHFKYDKVKKSQAKSPEWNKGILAEVLRLNTFWCVYFLHHSLTSGDSGGHTSRWHKLIFTFANRILQCRLWRYPFTTHKRALADPNPQRPPHVRQQSSNIPLPHTCRGTQLFFRWLWKQVITGNGLLASSHMHSCKRALSVRILWKRKHPGHRLLHGFWEYVIPSSPFTAKPLNTGRATMDPKREAHSLKDANRRDLRCFVSIFFILWKTGKASCHAASGMLRA